MQGSGQRRGSIPRAQAQPVKPSKIDHRPPARGGLVQLECRPAAQQCLEGQFGLEPRQRQDGERFIDTVRRTGLDPFDPSAAAAGASRVVVLAPDAAVVIDRIGEPTSTTSPSATTLTRESRAFSWKITRGALTST